MKTFINAIPSRMDYVVAQSGGTTSLPKFVITTDYNSVDDLKNAVADLQGFAAIFVASGATDDFVKVYGNCAK